MPDLPMNNMFSCKPYLVTKGQMLLKLNPDRCSCCCCCCFCWLVAVAVVVVHILFLLHFLLRHFIIIFLFLLILLLILIFLLHVLVIIVVLLVIVAFFLLLLLLFLLVKITIFLEWPLCLLFNPPFLLQVLSTDPPSLSSFRQVLVGAATGTESTKWFIISLYIQRLISKVIHTYSHHDGHDPHSRWWPTGITYINSFPQWPIMTHTYSCS